MKIILASSSPRRIEILRKFNINFEVIPSNFEENLNINNPLVLSIELARGKALEVSNRVDRKSIIISADTIVAKGQKIFGKPKDEKDAYYMLKELSGSTHEVITGICVYDVFRNFLICDYEITKVVFKELTDFEINDYIKTKEPFDKAGAYGIQGIGGLFVKKIDGCFYNVVGLPIYKLNLMLREVGVNLLRGSVDFE
ncbi:septum formation protein [Caloramator fervidus]|uniref:dTTP/UTP pyrophosphatase n=1 Tax=Caloramator fervidus TaxID=29344 RepID=A0A1H5VSU9_9CLOT|nr:Maf family protein [Caloramator fervidus]SEF89921.1 septum formation protein [Caloramator fervidus]